MAMQIQVVGAKRVNRMLLELPKTMDKEIAKVSALFMSNVQKSAKLRAPRMTGRLAKSIKLKKTRKGEIKITVESPYAYFQEFGFRPHFIHSNMSDRQGGTVGGLFNQFNSFFFVKKHTPFITPALEHNLSNLPKNLSKSSKRAISKAGGKK